MAERSEEVMELVERELKKNPDASTQELYEKAVKVDSDIKDLSARQFNARYPLQVKRKMAPSKPKSKKRTRRKTRRSSKAGDVNREAVRGVLLELVKDVTKAEDRAAVVDVLAGMDAYVDKIAKAAKG